MKFSKKQNHHVREQTSIGLELGIGGEDQLQSHTGNFLVNETLIYLDCGDSYTTVYFYLKVSNFVLKTKRNSWGETTQRRNIDIQKTCTKVRLSLNMCGFLGNDFPM